MKTAHLTLSFVTPTHTLFADRVIDSLTALTKLGTIQILPDHRPLVTILEPGEIQVEEENKKTPLVVKGGLLEVCDNKVVLLADEAEKATEIDIAAAEKKARELAQMLEKESEMDISTYEALMKTLAYEQARLAVGRKWRDKRSWSGGAS